MLQKLSKQAFDFGYQSVLKYGLAPVLAECNVYTVGQNDAEYSQWLAKQTGADWSTYREEYQAGIGDALDAWFFGSIAEDAIGHSTAQANWSIDNDGLYTVTTKPLPGKRMLVVESSQLAIWDEADVADFDILSREGDVFLTNQVTTSSAIYQFLAILGGDAEDLSYMVQRSHHYHYADLNDYDSLSWDEAVREIHKVAINEMARKWNIPDISSIIEEHGLTIVNDEGYLIHTVQQSTGDAYYFIKETGELSLITYANAAGSWIACPGNNFPNPIYGNF